MSLSANPGFLLEDEDIITAGQSDNPVMYGDYENLNYGLKHASDLYWTDGDTKDLAGFFGVGDETVQLWIRNPFFINLCVPPVVIGRRPANLVPREGVPVRPDLEGGRPSEERRERVFSRYRVWLCAMIARSSPGDGFCGFTRESPYTGRTRETEYYPGVISDCLKVFRSIYDYKASYFISQAWNRAIIYFPLFDDGKPLCWRLRLWYNEIGSNDDSDGLVEYPPEDGEDAEPWQVS